MDVDNPRHVVVITIAVVAVTVVAAFGFASLSDNPLVPDATLDVRDDSDEYDLRQEGIVGVVVIDHEGGEAIDIGETELLIGDQDSGIRFNRSNNWTATPSKATFAVYADGESVTTDTGFEPQDRLRVIKTTGTVNFNGSFETRIRLFHRPSQRVLLDDQVMIA